MKPINFLCSAACLIPVPLVEPHIAQKNCDLVDNTQTEPEHKYDAVGADTMDKNLFCRPQSTPTVMG